MKFVKDFKAFLSRGNVIDMAVAVVIGAAFTAVIQSIVKDLINPCIGFLTSGVDFSNLKVVLVEADEAKKVAEVAIGYGSFINAIINFIIVAFVLFLVIKGYGKLKRQEKVIEETSPKAPTEAELLTQILEELRKSKS